MPGLERESFIESITRDQLQRLIVDFQDVVTGDGNKKKRIRKALEIYWQISACKAILGENGYGLPTDVAGVLSPQIKGAADHSRENVRAHFEEDKPRLLEGIKDEKKAKKAEKICDLVIKRLKNGTGI